MNLRTWIAAARRAKTAQAPVADKARSCRPSGLRRATLAHRNTSIGLLATLLLVAWPVAAAVTGTWTGGDNTASASALGITVTQTGNLGSNPDYSVGSMQTGAFYTDPYGGTISGAAALNLNNVVPAGAPYSVTVTFSEPVNNPVLHVSRIGGYDAGTGLSYSSEWVLSSSASQGGAVSVTRLGGNGSFTMNAAGTGFRRTPGQASDLSTQCATSGTAGTGCGSVQFNGTGITSLTFSVNWVGTMPFGASDGLQFAWSLTGSQVIVAKQSLGGAGTFAFTGTNGVGSFSLNTATANPIQSASFAVTNHANAITITETPAASFVLQSVSCQDQNGAAVASSLSGGTATIASASYGGNQTITCTFANAKQGSIAIVKDAAPNGPQDFAFTATGAGLSGFSLDDDADAALSNTRTFNSLSPGSYSVTETALAGWSVTGLACTDPDNGTTANVVSGVANIDLDAGESITCTYTNASTQPSFGVCDSRMWVAQNSPTQLTRIDTTINPFSYSAVGGTNPIYNALGYNSADNYMYGLQGSTARLVRIGADGTALDLGLVSGLPVQSYFSGAFASTGNMLYTMAFPSQNQLYTINVATMTATAITLSRSVTVADFAFIGGLLYSVEQSGQLISINPATGAVTNLGAPNSLGSASNFGALFGAPNGLYGVYNSGGFYKIDLLTGAVTLISSAPSSNGNDGANCANANITFGADLQVAKTNTPASGPNDQASDTYTPGTTRTYTVVVTNAGPFGAANATFSDPSIANFTASSVTCGSPTGGAVCPTAANTTVALMQGSGIVVPSLPYSNNTSSSVTFTVTGNIAAAATGALSNVATVAAGAGTSDVTLANNSAIDTDLPTGTIVIVKDAVPNHAQDFAFATVGTGLSAFSLDDDADGTLPNTRTFTGLEPGSYSVTEGVVAGWSLTDLSCIDPDNGTTFDLANRVVTIDIDSGETVTCTYTNTKQTSLTLRKVSYGGVGTFDFTIDQGSASVVATRSLTTVTEGAVVTDSVPVPMTPGQTYRITENTVLSSARAWTLTDFSCANIAANKVFKNSGDTYTLLGVPAGADIVCTVTDRKSPTFQIRKTWVRAAPGDRVVLAWSPTAGPNNASGYAGNFQPVADATGNNTATSPPTAVYIGDTLNLTAESWLTQTGTYTTSDYLCTRSSDGTTFTVPASGGSYPLTDADTGANLLCSVTNTRRVADLSITKTNTPAAGANDQAGDSVARGAATVYSIVASNAGPDAADGAVIRDTPVSGLICATVTCSAAAGAVCPGTVDVATLQNGGLIVPTFPANSSISLTLSCTVQ